MKKCLFAALLLITAVAHAGTTSATGTIKGAVLDEKGQPIEGAMVNAELMDGRPRASAVRYVITDVRGRFLLDRLSWGNYNVFAQKPEDGYPDQNWALYSGNVFLTASVTPRRPLAHVLVHLGPKAAVLIGTITDSATGEKVFNPSFELRRTGIPSTWLSKSAAADFRVLVPSLTPITVEVKAKGYQPWSYPNPLRLNPGAELKLDIKLIPKRETLW